MPQKIFKRIGLRRDKNFSDLKNSKGALNNLLDTIVDGSNPDGTPNTFISEDLDAIRNLFAEGMTNGNYLQFGDSAVEFSNENGQNQILQPRSTYQNRLDGFESVSGDPRLQGGDGLTARYFNTDEVQDKQSTSVNALPVDDIFVGVTTGSQLPSDNLWDNGNFQYTGKIHPQSVNANGGVKWEGFFIPTFTAKHRFNVSSSASFSFDFEDPSYTGVGVNTYREYMRVSAATTSNCTASSVGNTLVLSTPDQSRFIGRGMIVTTAESSIIRPGTKVDTIDQTTGTISLINPDGNSVTESFASSAKSITFSRTIGDVCSKSVLTQVLEEGVRYRIRARFYIPPSADSQKIDRNIDFHFNIEDGSSRDLIFTQLYDLNYDFSESAEGSFIDFLDNSVGFGGGELGGQTSPEYVEVKSTKKIDIKYEPKTSFSGINVKTVSSASYDSGKNIISTNTNTTNMEVGNYVFGAGIPNNARIKQIITNSFFLIDKEVTAGSSGSQIVVIDHRGFVKRVSDCNNTNGTLTTNIQLAGSFITATNAVTLNGDVTISRTSGQTGVLTLANITDSTSVDYTFSDSFTTIPTSEFTAGKHYQISVSTNMDLQFVMSGAGGGSGGGAGGKLDTTISINSGTNYTLIIGTVGTENGTAGSSIQGGGGGSSVGGFSGGGFTGLFETTSTENIDLFNNAIIIAAGGGGRGHQAIGGGAGGGTTGANGNGTGGTQTAGGIGGSAGASTGADGDRLNGGNGGGPTSGGGGGGGGYYGGGGGRGDSNTSPGGQPGGGGSGFIDQTKGASNVSNFTDIDTNMLVITSVSDVPAYTRVTNIINLNQITINHTTAFSGRDVYFYQSRGLINKSLDTFCVPAAGNSILCKLVNADASAGGSTLTLADMTGVTPGQTVTGFGVQPGTTIILTLNNDIGLSLDLDANIKAGATVTIASAAEGDKGLCCPPTDTSPPFEPTNEGLKTPTANPDLIINQGNVIFENLIATVRESDYTFPRQGDGAGETKNNFSLYDLNNGEIAQRYFKIRCGVDFSNSNSGTNFRVLMKSI